MKSIHIPFIKDLERKSEKELYQIMELQAAPLHIDEVNWRKDFPYAPFCNARIARSNDYIAVAYYVSGLDLRAINTKDNGSQWEDSCCEFFVSDPNSPDYYNFEMNCAGFILGAKGPERNNREKRSSEEMKSIIRYASLKEYPIESNGDVHQWKAIMLIPFTLIGVNIKPSILKANFYKCGDKTAHPHFLSWNKIETTAPDFHRPDFFGELILD